MIHMLARDAVIELLRGKSANRTFLSCWGIPLDGLWECHSRQCLWALSDRERFLRACVAHFGEAEVTALLLEMEGV